MNHYDYCYGVRFFVNPNLISWSLSSCNRHGPRSSLTRTKGGQSPKGAWVHLHSHGNEAKGISHQIETMNERFRRGEWLRLQLNIKSFKINTW